MHITKIEISNFRSIRHMAIEPQRISTFIGKNSNGKSNVLKAIEFFFRASATRARFEDRCCFADEEPTWVECTFGGLAGGDVDELAKYILSDRTVCFRRTLLIDGAGAKTIVQGYVEEPEDDWLRLGFEKYSEAAFWKGIGINVFDYADKTSSGRITRAVHEQFCDRYRGKHASSIKLCRRLSETDAKGRQSTLSSILPQLIFVPAVGDIISEIYGKKSALLNTIVAGVVKKAESDQSYREASEKLQQAQGFINPSDHRLPALGRIENEIEQRLASWPGVKCTIRTDVGSLSDLLVSGLRLNIHDGTDSDLGSKGDGIQRQVLFQVFRLYAEYRRLSGIFADNDSVEGDQSSPGSIIIFEEPELFLHPQAQEQFYDDLVTVAEADQVFLATHSNHLLRLEYADSLYIVRRNKLDEPTRLSGPSSRWKDSGERHQAKELDFFNSDIAKMFFADRIILTEGQADVIYLAAAARRCGCFSRATSIISAGGIQGIPKLQRILNALRVPYCVAHDADPGNRETEKTALEIAALAAEAQGVGHSCEVYVFTDTVPHEYFGGDPSEGSKKVDRALRNVAETAPTMEFVTRVQRLYGLNPANPSLLAAPEHTPP